MLKNQTHRRSRQRRCKLSRRMKKRGGVKSVRSSGFVKSVPSSGFPDSNVHDLGWVKKTRNFKKIQDHCIRLLMSTVTINPSGTFKFNMDEYRQLKDRLGYTGMWKNIRTREGKIISDEKMNDIHFIKKLNSVVGSSDPEFIYINKEWQLRANSTPEEIANYDNYILWLSQQNRLNIFWVPENYQDIMHGIRYNASESN